MNGNEYIKNNTVIYPTYLMIQHAV